MIIGLRIVSIFGIERVGAGRLGIISGNRTVGGGHLITTCSIFLFADDDIVMDRVIVGEDLIGTCSILLFADDDIVMDRVIIGGFKRAMDRCVV